VGQAFEPAAAIPVGLGALDPPPSSTQSRL